jgi:hypothetical protein
MTKFLGPVQQIGGKPTEKGKPRRRIMQASVGAGSLPVPGKEVVDKNSIAVLDKNSVIIVSI